MPRLTSLPETDDLALQELLTDLHLASRDLGKLTRPKLWPEHMKAAWTAELRRFTPILRAALDKDDPLQLTQALLDLLELPTLALRKYLPSPGSKTRKFDHPDPPGTERKGSPNLNKAKNLAYQTSQERQCRYCYPTEWPQPRHRQQRRCGKCTQGARHHSSPTSKKHRK